MKPKYKFERIFILVASISTLTSLLVGGPVDAHEIDGRDDSSRPIDAGEQDQTIEDSVDGNVQRGLGEYGPEGSITVDELPGDLDLRVSSHALAVAQSPALATARRGWSDDRDFVHQVNYQLRVREQLDYMNSEPSHIGSVLSSRPSNAGLEALGLYMTDREAREFVRRSEVAQRMPGIARIAGKRDSATEGEEAMHSRNFGGIWQDQMDGGKIVVALVNPRAVSTRDLVRLAGGWSIVKVIEVEHSYDEVRGIRARIADAIEGSVDFDIIVNTTPEGERIEVVTPNPALARSLLPAGIPSELVSVTRGEASSTTGDPNTTHSEANQQPGLRIEFDPGGNCTWGSNGHSNNYNYLVTAGHCGNGMENFQGWSDNEEIHQNNSFHLTPGSQYFQSIDDNGWDMKRVSSPQADSNCYHANSECRRFIRDRTWHNSWEINGSWVCASLGNTNDYDCGLVLEENWGDSGCGDGNRRVRFGIPTIPGDSGTGVMYPIWQNGRLGPAATIDAIQSCGGVPDFSGGNTAYDVKTQFNNAFHFDFNCASSAVTGRAAGNWGSCPVRQRS